MKTPVAFLAHIVTSFTAMVCYLVLVALDLTVLFLLAIVSFFAMGLRHLSDAVEALQALIVLKQTAMSKDLYEWADK